MVALFRRRAARGVESRPLPIALRLIGGLIALIGIGATLLWLSGAGSERPLRPHEALFTATSALTVTGLSVIVPSRDLTPSGQVILLCLIQLGGVGYMAFAVIAFRLIGRDVNLLDRVALRDSLGLVSLAGIMRTIVRVLLTVIVLQGIGALLLWAHWRDGPLGERAGFYAVFHAVSAFCNAGFDLFAGLPEFPTGIPIDDRTLLIKGTLIFIGGLGIPVIADLLLLPWKRRISLHTRLTLVAVAVLVVAGAGAIFASETQPKGVLADLPVSRQVTLSLFQSVSARTAGFAGLPSFESLRPASQQAMIVLMFIGCAPASMGGGITTGTLVMLLVALWSYARGLPNVRVGKRRIPPENVRKAAAVLTVSLMVTSLATWLLLVTHDTTLDRALFEVISAFATCGLTLAFTNQLNAFGEGVIMLMMFWGRLGALSIVLALAHRVPPDRVTYPEEQILIG